MCNVMASIARSLICYTLMAVGSCGFSQSTPAGPEQISGGCVEEIVIPRYSEFARNAGLSGTAEVSVLLLGTGKPPEIKITGVHSSLEWLVREALSASRFSGRCSNITVTLKFEFLLQAGAGTPARPSTFFIPPNSFRIRVAPSPLDVSTQRACLSQKSRSGQF